MGGDVSTKTDSIELISSLTLAKIFMKFDNLNFYQYLEFDVTSNVLTKQFQIVSTSLRNTFANMAIDNSLFYFPYIKTN